MTRLRTVQFGAGVAGGLLAIAGFVAALFAPLRYCTETIPSGGICPASAIRSASLLQVHPSAGVWMYLCGMVVALLAAAGGAIIEARTGQRTAILPLWIGAVLAFMGCAFSALGIGLFFLPAVLAILLAGFASLLRRRSRAGLPRSVPGSAKKDRI
ncbi:MAG: hypothetical protein OJF49_002589 [Ktedonobacterales bacterium]|nr:MAG: hypothetical protein OJF49_002589 [Ktedonobacterales bacterium]